MNDGLLVNVDSLQLSASFICTIPPLSTTFFPFLFFSSYNLGVHSFALVGAYTS
jgi:hypothetical protein